MTEADFEKLIEHKYRKMNRSGEDMLMEEIDKAIAIFDVSKKLLNEHVSDDLVVSETKKRTSPEGKPFAAGQAYEKKLADLIRSHPASLSAGLKVDDPKTSGPGSDLIIRTRDLARLTSIEVKNIKKLRKEKSTAGLDFGQFKLEYNIDAGTWSVGGNSKQNALVIHLYTEYLHKHLDYITPKVSALIKNYIINNPPEKWPSDEDKLKKAKEQNNLFVGFKQIKGKSEILNGFRKAFFARDEVTKDNIELKLYIDPSKISQYYAKDDFIQIGKRGLYAINQAVALNFSVPWFETSIIGANLRLRIKYHSTNDKTNLKTYSFTVAMKIDDVTLSNVDLEKDGDLTNFIPILINNVNNKTQQATDSIVQPADVQPADVQPAIINKQ